jgi:YfiH family protein
VFFWHERRAGIDLAVTDRHGGVSSAPFAGLNLARHVGDEPSSVEVNRARMAEAIGLAADRLVFMNQCHGAAVEVVEGPWPGDPPACDALITTATDLALVVLVADCVPVLLADPVAGIVGAVHAGRPGMVANVVGAALDAMADLGSRAPYAIVGPSVCGRCYEVPAAMRAAAAAVEPISATLSWTGTPAIDVGAGVVAQLTGRGVPLTWVSGCTREDDRLFSYRRSTPTGRFAGVIRRYAVDPTADAGGELTAYPVDGPTHGGQEAT